MSAVKPEPIEVKTEAADGMRAPAIPADNGSELTKKKEYLIAANEELREAIMKLSQRQQILEEYVEVELDGVTGIQRYKANKKRMRFVLDIKTSEPRGRRSQKYEQMMSVLKAANGFWKYQKARIHRLSNRESRLRYESCVPPELAELRLFVKFGCGMIARKPVKRCHRCYDESHEMRDCPYKHVETRTPEVNAMIQARKEELERIEGRDPLLSKQYKARHLETYKLKEKIRKQTRLLQKLTKKAEAGNAGIARKIPQIQGKLDSLVAQLKQKQ